MADTRMIDDLEARQSTQTLVDKDLPWFRDQVIQTVKGNLQGIVFLVVCDAEKRHPLSLDLVTEFE